MVESITEASRPAKRRSYRRPESVQKAATDSLFKGLDRFGLAPILLLGLAYIGHTQVVQPIAAAYAKMVADVAENNKLLKEAVENNNDEDTERVAAITAAQALNKSLAEENKALNTRILEAISNADAARRQIHSETRVLLERVERLIQKGGTNDTGQ
jgi:hypothetical protein